MYQENQLTGTWFGFAQADLYTYRIELVFPHSGIGARFSSVSDSLIQLPISDWKLHQPNKLVINVAPGSEVIKLEGDLLTESMFVGSVYGSSGWSNSVRFYKTAPFELRMRKLQDVMADLNRKKNDASASVGP
jgi:hypothetical protein